MPRLAPSKSDLGHGHPRISFSLPWPFCGLQQFNGVSRVPTIDLLTLGLGMLLLGRAHVADRSLHKHAAQAPPVVSVVFASGARIRAAVRTVAKVFGLDILDSRNIVRPFGADSYIRTAGMGGLGRHSTNFRGRIGGHHALAVEGRDPRRRCCDRSSDLLAPHLSRNCVGPPHGRVAVVE